MVPLPSPARDLRPRDLARGRRGAGGAGAARTLLTFPSPPCAAEPLRRCPRARLRRAALAHHHGRRRAAQDPVSGEGAAGWAAGPGRSGAEAGMRSRGAGPGPRGVPGELRGPSGTERVRQGRERGPGRGSGSGAWPARRRRCSHPRKTRAGRGWTRRVTGSITGASGARPRRFGDAGGGPKPSPGGTGCPRAPPARRSRRWESSLCSAGGGWDGERRESGRDRSSLQRVTLWFNNRVSGPAERNNCVLAVSLRAV